MNTVYQLNRSQFVEISSKKKNINMKKKKPRSQYEITKISNKISNKFLSKRTKNVIKTQNFHLILAMSI